MSKPFFLALALLGLAACGSDSKPQAAPTHSRAAGHATKPAATRSKASTKKSKSKAPARTAARRDTTTQKNPLTNH
ncbi:MAG TPA: hypothetical protein VH116_06335 [Gemmatimonadales bacterium]|jgi:hypothetical protein|nr:hypothetical protein [Gemmatimonadales bacterium]